MKQRLIADRNAIYIKSDRLTIESFRREHLTERYVAWLNDPEVVRYSEQRHQKHTLKSCRDYFDSFGKNNNLFLAIVEIKESLGHIGNITVQIDVFNRIADIAILIGEKSAWRKGYGLEAWKMVCKYLFDHEVRKITAGTMDCNISMLKVIKYSGMNIEAERKKHFLLDGDEVGVIYAALFK